MISHHKLHKSNYADDDWKSNRCAQDDHMSRVLLASQSRNLHTTRTPNMLVTEPFEVPQWCLQYTNVDDFRPSTYKDAEFKNLLTTKLIWMFQKNIYLQIETKINDNA